MSHDRIDTDSDFYSPHGVRPGSLAEKVNDMTDQSPPARPDGDALENLADEIERSNGLLRMVQGQGTIELGIKKTAMVIAALRATSPAREAAEGAGEVRRWNDATKMYEWMPATAPPKPAPDAVRIAQIIRDHLKIADWLEAEWINDCAEAIASRSSAPLPPADGATSEFRQECAKHAAFLRHASTTMQNDDYSKPKTNERTRLVSRIEHILDASEFLDRQSLSPSATGAAEPIAWRDALEEIQRMALAGFKGDEDGDSMLSNIHNLALKTLSDAGKGMAITALPPVRGDQEAIARIIGGNIFGSPDSEVGPATQAARKSALAKADAILSLPVQYGASEREAVIEECANAVERALCGSILSNIGKSLAADVRALSRQPPQSSSDGEGR